MNIKRHRVRFRSVKDFAGLMCTEISLLFRYSFAERISIGYRFVSNGNTYQLQAVNNRVSELVWCSISLCTLSGPLLPKATLYLSRRLSGFSVSCARSVKKLSILFINSLQQDTDTSRSMTS